MFMERHLFTALSGLEPTHKPRLLLVDDQPINIQIMHQVFAEDCQVFMATSGVQALQQCRDNPPDLVLLDVVMPEMDGPTLLKVMRGRNPDLKIIFVSGYAEDAFEKSLPENQQFAFLPKPFTLSQLVAAVKETMAPS